MNDTSIKLSPSAKAVLRYYLALNKADFRAGLEEIRDTVFGPPPPGKKPDWRIKAVQRANTALRDAGIIVWKSGFNYAGARGCRNHYWLTKETIQHLRSIDNGRLYDGHTDD